MTKECQYAIKALLALARAKERTDAGVVCRQEGIPPAEGKKVMQMLVKRGVLDSRRGPHGGFSIVGEPTVARVIAAMDPRELEIPFGGPAGEKLTQWRQKTTIARLARTAA